MNRNATESQTRPQTQGDRPDRNGRNGGDGQPSSSARASSLSIDDTLERYEVARDRGLSDDEARQRREKYGPNRLEEAEQRSAWQIFIAQFKSPIILMLAIAAVLSAIFQEWIEAIAVTIAIVLNTSIGFFTELKAVSSMEALQELSRTKAAVRRNGDVKEIPAEELVPGDIVVFDSGDLIAADLRIIEASKLQADESALTGESVPVSKQTDSLEGDLPVAERTNLLFKGTAVTRGAGEGVVVATGTDSELGRISELTAQAEDEVTPLEKRLGNLGRRLIWVTLAIAIVIGVAGWLGGKELVLIIETAIALAIAAVPEGLPIVATVALARGMWRMAKRNALIERLSAVETLGSTNIICTDKTGTLTENRMTVRKIALGDRDIEVTGEGLQRQGKFRCNEDTLDPQENDRLRSLLEIGVLCNNANLPEREGDSPVGDPMEVALMVAGAKADLKRDALLENTPEAREVAFDSDTKMMATFHETEGGYRVAVKGAPEAVLSASSQQRTADGERELSEGDREDWKQRFYDLASEGLRILAFAEKTASDTDAEPYGDLTFIGVVGLLDPPREDVKKAIAECHEAGIRVIMVTGDQPVTARNIADAVGVTGERETEARKGKALKSMEELDDRTREELRQVSVFARVSPEQKLNLIALHKEDGQIVAMTGDGVNDAPALKKADIGVAMGARGTQVAREAADMVLQDDAFSSILAAVEQGRAIFANIRKFTIYLLSGNTGEIFAVGIASVMPIPLPLLPLQILFINAINDVFPALALGVGKGNPQQMQRPPRDSKEPILTRGHWVAIALYGLLIAVATLGIFLWCLKGLGYSQEKAVTISFLSLAFARLWHVFNMRDDRDGLFRNEVTINPYIWGALAVCTVLLLSGVYVPFLADVLQLVDPGLQGWGLILGTSFVPLIVGQIVKEFRTRRSRIKQR